MTLIVLEVFVTGKGPEQAGSLFGWINTGLKKAISPDVALIPTRASAKAKAPAKASPAPKSGSSDDWKNGPIGLPTNPSVTKTVTV